MVVRRLPPVSLLRTPAGRSQGMSRSGWPGTTSQRKRAGYPGGRLVDGHLKKAAKKAE